MKVIKNDTVLVVSGNSKGKKGKVLKVFPKEERVIVEGVNFIKRHTRKSQKNPQGGIVEREAPIHASNVKLIWAEA
jgi:large subunit ribosomal protein L24